MLDPRYAVSPDVEEVRREGRALVALETAVLTHGLPFPHNLQVFRSMLEAVEQEGCRPAPVGVVDGVVRVGLTPGEIERLAAPGRAVKAGLHDLPALVARRADAGTTVAATLWASRRAGIQVFATGGIGGVHRGAAQTCDLSGDLFALARYGGCVVCSGAKVILDIPATVEVLETLGVCVVGYGTGTLPAFVCADSGVAVRHRVEDPGSAAAVVRARDALGLTPAVLLVNPPPVRSAVPRPALEEALQQVLAQAEGERVAGADLTPFLLRSLASRPGLDTLEANRDLLVSNARVAARVAAELAAAPA